MRRGSACTGHARVRSRRLHWRADRIAGAGERRTQGDGRRTRGPERETTRRAVAARAGKTLGTQECRAPGRSSGLRSVTLCGGERGQRLRNKAGTKVRARLDRWPSRALALEEQGDPFPSSSAACRTSRTAPTSRFPPSFAQSPVLPLCSPRRCARPLLPRPPFIYLDPSHPAQSASRAINRHLLRTGPRSHRRCFISSSSLAPYEHPLETVYACITVTRISCSRCGSSRIARSRLGQDLRATSPLLPT